MFTINKFTKQIAAGLYVSPSFFRSSLDAVRLCPRFSRTRIEYQQMIDGVRELAKRAAGERDPVLEIHFQHWCEHHSNLLQKLNRLNRDPTANAEFQKDFNFARKLVQLYGLILFKLPVNLQCSPDIVREAALQNPEVLTKVDFDLARKLVQLDIRILDILPVIYQSIIRNPELLKNEDIRMAIINLNVDNITYAGLDLLRNEETLLKILKHTCYDETYAVLLLYELKIDKVVEKIPHDTEAIQCLEGCLNQLHEMTPARKALLQAKKNDSERLLAGGTGVLASFSWLEASFSWLASFSWRGPGLCPCGKD